MNERKQSRQMRCVIGIDSGGTKCEALVATVTGQALGWGRCDVRSPASGRGLYGSGRTRQSIRSAVREALSTVHCDHFIVAAAGVRMTAGLFDMIPNPVRSITHVKEFKAAFTQAGESCGIVALAGTGAFVHGVTRDRRELLLDGLGPLLGDYGGGYHIGSLAVRAAARSRWHTRHKTALEDAIPRALHSARHDGRKPKGMVDFMLDNPDRGEIANLAPVVFAAALAGDRVAVEIMDHAAAALAETLRDVVDRLGMAEEDYPLIGAGGAITHSPYYWERFCAAARSFAPRLRPVRLNGPPVLGIVLHALLTLRPAEEPALRAALNASTRELLARAAEKGDTAS